MQPTELPESLCNNSRLTRIYLYKQPPSLEVPFVSKSSLKYGVKCPNSVEQDTYKGRVVLKDSVHPKGLFTTTRVPWSSRMIHQQLVCNKRSDHVFVINK